MKELIDKVMETFQAEAARISCLVGTMNRYYSGLLMVRILLSEPFLESYCVARDVSLSTQKCVLLEVCPS